MASDPFLGEDARVLTADAFDFILTNELKRALRSQNFLTLLTLEPVPHQANGDQPQLVREIVRLTGREVRETDLLSQSGNRVSVVLLDADLQSSMRVLDRLLSRFAHYEFASPVSIEVGAACCPTHGADVTSLRRAAEFRRLPPHQDTRDASNAQ